MQVSNMAAGSQSKERRRPAFADYLQLTKPELTGLSVLTSLCGFYLASPTMNWYAFLLTGLGTSMIGGGLGTLNQFAEHVYDAAMKRTERRPLPSKRMPESAAFIFGLALLGGGLTVLQIGTNSRAAMLGTLTIFFYLLAYTPLKRVTWLATIVGGIPGALPPMIGWTAATGDLPLESWVLFGILYFWQIPHFLSLAWMYKRDYARAGYRALPVSDQSGRSTGIVIVLHLVLLLPVSVALYATGTTGLAYAAGAVLAGGLFLFSGLGFLRACVIQREEPKITLHARRVFYASLVYLPVLMGLMVIDRSSM